MIKEITEKYINYNKRYFGDLLPKVPISISKRMTRKAGIVLFVMENSVLTPLELRLSLKYMQEYPEDIDIVLIHEMIHIYLGSIEHDLKYIEVIDSFRERYNIEIALEGKFLA